MNKKRLILILKLLRNFVLAFFSWILGIESVFIVSTDFVVPILGLCFAIGMSVWVWYSTKNLCY